MYSIRLRKSQVVPPFERQRESNTWNVAKETALCRSGLYPRPNLHLWGKSQSLNFVNFSSDPDSYISGRASLDLQRESNTWNAGNKF